MKRVIHIVHMVFHMCAQPVENRHIQKTFDIRSVKQNLYGGIDKVFFWPERDCLC